MLFRDTSAVNCVFRSANHNRIDASMTTSSDGLSLLLPWTGEQSVQEAARSSRSGSAKEAPGKHAAGVREDTQQTSEGMQTGINTL